MFSVGLKTKDVFCVFGKEKNPGNLVPCTCYLRVKLDLGNTQKTSLVLRPTENIFFVFKK